MSVPPPPAVSRASPPSVVIPRHGLRSVIINFTPSWFAVCMGTGIISILLHIAPHRFNGQTVISTVFYVLNIALFVTFLALSIARYSLWPWVWWRMLYHPAQSLFLGTFPMALATIINATVLIAVPAFGYWAVELAWALWWIDVALSIATCFGVPAVMFQVHSISHEQMTAAWLLPVVPTVVAAASGATVATVLSADRAYITLLLSYALEGIGLSLSFLIMAVYLHRLAVYKLPTAEVIVSAFLPLGPLGQGAFGIIQLSQAGRTVFPAVGFTAVSNAADIVFVGSTLIGLFLWGFGLFWLTHGVVSVTIRTWASAGHRLHHNMGFWGFIFPLGVWTAATVALGNALPSEFFNYLSIVLLIVLVLLYLYVAGGSVHGIITGRLLVAPCLAPLVNETLAAYARDKDVMQLPAKPAPPPVLVERKEQETEAVAIMIASSGSPHTAASPERV